MDESVFLLGYHACEYFGNCSTNEDELRCHLEEFPLGYHASPGSFSETDTTKMNYDLELKVPKCAKI
ncbi:unnamed protein product [Calypogeia fissa]